MANLSKRGLFNQEQGQDNGKSKVNYPTSAKNGQIWGTCVRTTRTLLVTG
jgi:hypothetical protein